MDQVLGIFINFLVFVSDRTDCPETHYVKYNYEYEVPEGLIARNKWGDRGPFTVDDGFDNSMYVGFLNSDSIEDDVNWYREAEYMTVLEESSIGDDAYRILLDNPSLYDPYDEIMWVKNPKGFVVMTMFKMGDPLKHAAFEENALKLARSVVQGEPDETRKNRDCDHPSLWDLLPWR
jgi:hypothetical protein